MEMKFAVDPFEVNAVLSSNPISTRFDLSSMKSPIHHPELFLIPFFNPKDSYIGKRNVYKVDRELTFYIHVS